MPGDFCAYEKKDVANLVLFLVVSKPGTGRALGVHLLILQLTAPPAACEKLISQLDSTREVEEDPYGKGITPSALRSFR